MPLGPDPGVIALMGLFKGLDHEALGDVVRRARMRRIHGGRRTEAGVEIDFPLSRQDLAEMTGTTLHTVSRTLSAWRSAGW